MDYILLRCLKSILSRRTRLRLDCCGTGRLQCRLIKYSGIGAEVTGKALQGAFVAGLIAFDDARPDERD